MALPVERHLWANGTDTAAATVSLVPAPGVGFRIRVLRLHLTNSTADTLIVRDNTTEKYRVFLPANGENDKEFGALPFDLTENQPLTLAKGTATTPVGWMVQYLTVPVSG